MLSAVRFRREGDAGRDNKDWSTAASSYYHYLKLVPDDADIWVRSCLEGAGKAAGC
jgi:hypothetical protein